MDAKDIKTKICTKCKIPKESNKYYSNKTSKDKLSSHCKSCFNGYYNINKKEIIKKDKTRRKNNQLKYKNISYKSCRKYQLKHQVEIKKYQKEYNKINSKILNKKERFKRKTDINFKLRKN